MNKLRAGCFVFVIFVLMTSLLGQAQTATAFKKGSIWIGGLYSISNLGYQYNYSIDYFGEPMTIDDEVVKSNFPGFTVGAGYFVSRNIELFGAAYYAKNSKFAGQVVFAIPNEFFYNDIASDTATQNRSGNQLDLVAGLKYHLSPNSKINPYIGAGACYASATVQYFEDATYLDDYTYWYVGGVLVDITHEVTITQVTLQEAKAKALGGFALGGLEFRFSPSVTIFAEGIYRFAKKSVVHPFSSAIGEPENINVDMGGPVFSGGFRIYF